MAEFECSNSRILTTIEVFRTLEGVCAHASQRYACVYTYVYIERYAALLKPAQRTLVMEWIFPQARRKN